MLKDFYSRNDMKFTESFILRANAKVIKKNNFQENDLKKVISVQVPIQSQYL